MLNALPTPAGKSPPSNRASIDFECEIDALPLTGALPAGLAGTLVRNGPNPLAPDPQAHWFLGDGMLHAFRIHDGRVSYRNRWVQTMKLARARAARRLPAPPDAAQDGQDAGPDDGVANTHVIAHAGRMLALEEAHMPVEMAAATLGTIGPMDFGGSLPPGPFTAHPKTDPHTGELLFFGYGTPEPLSAGMRLGVVSSDGRVTRCESFDAPYAAMVHDFAVTAGHVVFPILPLTASRERAERGGPPFAWEPALCSRVGLMPRGGRVSDIAWWQGPACFVFHVMNAWEDGRTLYMDVMQFQRPPLFPLPDGQPAGGARESALLTRWRFDLDDPERTFTSEVLQSVSGEFPRIDERFTGRAHRHGWYVGNLPDAEGELQLARAIVHVDAASPGHADLYALPDGDRSSEAVFVPRDAAADEGDGWLLAVLFRGASRTSELAVFDARRVADGPLCLAALPHRVPDGFHGNWFPADAPVPASATPSGETR